MRTFKIVMWGMRFTLTDEQVYTWPVWHLLIKPKWRANDNEPSTSAG